MELVVDLAAVTVILGDPDDLSTLSVRVAAPESASPDVEADVHRLIDVIVAAHAGRSAAEGHEEVLIDPSALRFHAAGQVGADWDERFARMLVAAAEHGWVAEDGYLRAHVTWPTPSELTPEAS